VYELRPYQAEAVEAITRALSHQDRALCVMATGLGKSLCMIDLARLARKPVLMLMGRVKLVEQTHRVAKQAGIDTALWSGTHSRRDRAKLTIASIHSADDLDASDVGLIMIDEVHNVDAAEGRYAAFLARHPGVKVAGFTATPWRSGTPIYGEDDSFFSGISYYKGIEWGIANGFLVAPIAKAMPDAWDARGVSLVAGDYSSGELAELVSDEGKIRAQVRDAMIRLEGRKSIVWVCTNIEHAERVWSCIGGNAALMHSKVDCGHVLPSFIEGRVRHVVSVMMLSEGIDVPRVDAIVLMRPTRSPTLMVQCIGRGLRPFEDKKNCLVLDYGRVIESCGPVNAPFLKDGQRRDKKKEEELLEKTLTVCPECLSYVSLPAKVCGDCGFEFPRLERDVTKALTDKAAEEISIINAEPEMLECRAVTLHRHKARNGNDCLRLDFSVRGRMWPVKAYGSQHPFSWTGFQRVLYELTPFRFDSWQECFDAVEQIGSSLVVPSRVRVEHKNGFEGVTRIEHRASDS